MALPQIGICRGVRELERCDDSNYDGTDARDQKSYGPNWILI
jgi:hypothetical protein